MSLTVHFSDGNFTLQSKCLQTLEVPHDHNTVSLKDVISTMFSNWKINDKVRGGITDNGSNIVNAFRLLKIDQFPYIAHTLQLAVNKGLKVVRVQRIIGRCKAIISHFKRSTKETYKLREKQELLKLPQHMLVQDCVTCWGSTLCMLQCLMEQRTAISAILVEGKDRHLMLESGDWEVVLKITDGDYPTAKAVKQEIKKDLEDRYHNTTVKRIINFATFLDPRYKGLPFLDSFSKQEIIEQVEDELISLECDTMDQQMVAEDEGEVAIEDEEPPVSKKKKGPNFKAHRGFILKRVT